MPPIYIVAAKRTPFGRFLGSLAHLSPVELAIASSEAALAEIDRGKIDLCIFGNVLSAGHGMNISRQIALALGLRKEIPAYTVNQMCASGMTSIINAVTAIRAGEANAVLCGGTESMSQAPRLLHGSRIGKKLGDIRQTDSLLNDGLIDPSSREHMGLTAELLADRYKITRPAQDEFALSSHRKWKAAQDRGAFDAERISLKELATDEQARPDSTLEQLSKLAPAFKPNGGVSAANSSGINDGAATLVVASSATCKQNGWRPLAKITGWATVGCEPQTMGLGPVFAIRKLRERFGIDPTSMDAVEINEAFAAQVLACLKELCIENVNANGGGIALGHPIGASGARLATHLAHRVAAGEIKTAIGSLCVGGGMGIALALADCTLNPFLKYQ